MVKGSHRINILPFQAWTIAGALAVGCGLAGCEGDPGAPGRSLLPVDKQPPVVEIVFPIGGDTVYGAGVLEVRAWDDVAVSSLTALVDGALYPAAVFQPRANFWRAAWDVTPLGSGHHTLQVRARDAAGREAGSPLLAVYTAPGDSAPPTDTLAWYIPSPAGDFSLRRDYVRLPFPGSGLGLSEVAVRFTTPAPCTLKAAAVRLFWDADWQLSAARLGVKFYSGSAGEPDSVLGQTAISRRAPLNPEDLVDVNDWFTIRVPSSGLPITTEDFFISVGLPEQIGDTIAVVADDGRWDNTRSWGRAARGWRPLADLAGRAFNVVLYAVVSR